MSLIHIGPSKFHSSLLVLPRDPTIRIGGTQQCRTACYAMAHQFRGYLLQQWRSSQDCNNLTLLRLHLGLRDDALHQVVGEGAAQFKIVDIGCASGHCSIGRRYREGCRRFGKWMLQRYISLRRVALDQLTQFVEGSCHGSFHPLQNDFLVLNVVQAEVRLRKGPRAPKGSVYYSLDNRQLT